MAASDMPAGRTSGFWRGSLLAIAMVAAPMLMAVHYAVNAPQPIIKPGRLSSIAATGDVEITLGGFRLLLREQAAGLRFSVHHNRNSRGNTVFDSGAGQSFIAVGRGEARYTQARGMTRFRERTNALCSNLHITGLDLSNGGSLLHITGLMACPDGPLEVFIRFEERRESKQILGFDIQLGKDAKARGYNRIYFGGLSSGDERFHGLGAQMAAYNFKGREIPIVVSEQGVGRGLQPVSFIADLLHDGAGGQWHSSYAPVPQTLTSKGRGMFAATYATSVFDLRAQDRFTIKVHDSHMTGGLIAGRSTLEMISAYTGLIGRQRPLPDWVMDGAIIGAQGGTAHVSEKLATVQAADMPVAALWLQDWVGQRTTSFGKQLWWSWTLDRHHYPRWEDFTSQLKADNIRVLGYINPYLVNTKAYEKATGRRRNNLFNTARVAGYLVKNKAGKVHLEPNTSFDFAQLDLTNPAARDFALRTIRQRLIGNGFSGWMADFGEALPMDGQFAADIPGPIAHNSYPDIWAQIQHDAIDTHPKRDEFLIFHRAGHYRAANYATAFWLGDQLVSWDKYDGLKSAIVGHMNAGISGHAITHADVGGYTTIDSPAPWLISHIHRGDELLLRWAEFAAFTPIFRTHEGNRPDANHQAWSSTHTARGMAKMAKLYACLKPYRQSLNAEVRDYGWPMTRHPSLHYPDEPAYRDMTHQQIMMGDAIMLAPISDAGTTTARITLPAGGDWIHLWSGTIKGPGSHDIAAPIGQPAAFVRQDSIFAADILGCVPKGTPVDATGSR